ncbi:hypothetical protein [Eubacterium oxidoreducens]|uniref:Uncharacterized protein n=1 Tax=Eubacterium oxidoreducens TaxID=1732 RepID=A0A1G6B498_EUBOX|nr:hypothetical protein [Eubacterium oxidoreducens]SDB15402.1 hypothetical protein SAMN02910417_01147 [Eubacterium oxidoreducens]
MEVFTPVQFVIELSVSELKKYLKGKDLEDALNTLCKEKDAFPVYLAERKSFNSAKSVIKKSNVTSFVNNGVKYVDLTCSAVEEGHYEGVSYVTDNLHFLGWDEEVLEKIKEC